jgi:type IV pilus assembly protein PilE
VTLLEMLLVVALAGILAAIAYPSYRAQLLRANRLEAIEALLAAAAAQERFHLAHGRYADRFAAGDDGGLRVPAVTGSGRYELDLATPAPAEFIVRVTPRPGSGQEEDRRCSEIWIRADGRRGARDDLGGDSTLACWR